MPPRRKSKQTFTARPRPRRRTRGRGAEGSEGLYTIGVVAERYDVHPQTLRIYERAGLLLPARSEGNTRLYSDENLDALEFILNLTRNLGVNLAGIEVVLNMRARMLEMQGEVERMMQIVQREFIARRAGEEGALVPVRRIRVSHEKEKNDSQDKESPSRSQARRS